MVAVHLVVLLVLPDIEELINDQDTMLIAEVENLRCGRIMSHADGIAPHFLQNLNLALIAAGMESRAQSPQVVVFAHALETHLLAIQVEAVLLPLNGAHTETRFLGIDHSITRKHSRMHSVHVR